MTSTSSFPLYNNLAVNLLETDLMVKEKEFIIRHLKKVVDSTVFERVYALIRCYQLHHSKDISIVPFEGKPAKGVPSNIQFDLEKLPIPLKHIIHKFCVLESKINNP